MSNNNRYVRLSKTMSVALRHDPDSFGIELDEGGWVDVDKLLDALRKHKRWEGINEEDFHTVMSVSDKKRFEISDGHIRALYGHSIPMKIVKEPTTPSPLLYHGTARRNLDNILQQGILPMSRQYVHMSEDVETATKVGRRKAQDIVILAINTQAEPGVPFYCGNDQTWLADRVPPSMIDVLN